MRTKTLTAAALALALIPTLGLAQEGPRHPMPQFDFSAADADASGGVSYPEFTAYLQAQMQERRAERLGDRADRLLAAGDADGDGALTRDELIAGAGALGDERRARMRDHGDSRGAERREMRGHGPRGMDPERMANRLFDRIDSDNDGQVSPDEAQIAQERMQERFQRRQARQSNG